MTIMRDQLLNMLKIVARALGENLRKRLVFVGGCTTAIFITDPVTLEAVRATDDVDLIIDLTGRIEWAKLQSELRQKGFAEASEDSVICRMRLGQLKVDFMPDDETILGFSNRWYAPGIKTATEHRLDDALIIKILTPPLFLATKLEAFKGRGQNDLFSSRDAEDILLVLDGRPELLDEVVNSAVDVRTFIASEIHALIDHHDFDDFVEGNLRGQSGRAKVVKERFIALSKISAIR